jgi:phospholipase/lecithinase/hemolysin
MTTRSALVGAVLLALLASPVSAAPFSAIYVFGDSLSDAGNAYIATNGAVPPAPPYALVNGFGVFSNGPLWVQDLASRLGLGPLLPSLAGGTDFAVGGAQTGAFGAYQGSPGDLLPASGNPTPFSQLGMFKADVPHPATNALYTLSIGSNDLETIFARDAGNPAQAAADAAAALTNIATFIGDLAAEGAHTFDVLNVPDLGLTPMTRALGPPVSAQVSAFTAAFDAALQTTLANLAQSYGLDLHLVDTFALLDQAVADPAAFGLTDVTDPCLPPGSVIPCADPDRYLFWDDVHPTETGQRLIADAAAPVPEPSAIAILASSLGLLTLITPSRRRRVKSGVRL